MDQIGYNIFYKLIDFFLIHDPGQACAQETMISHLFCQSILQSNPMIKPMYEAVHWLILSHLKHGSLR